MAHHRVIALCLTILSAVVACGSDPSHTELDAGSAQDSATPIADSAPARDSGDVDAGEPPDIGCEAIAGAGPYVDEPVYPLGDHGYNLTPATDPNTNAKLRGFQCEPGFVSLYRTYGAGGAADPIAPKFYTFFEPFRIPAMPAQYAVGLGEGVAVGIEDHPPHLISLETAPGEVLHAPALDIDGTTTYAGINMVVAYVDEDSIVLHYNNIDYVSEGYRLHVFGVCPEPTLSAQYNDLMAQGRTHLPGLRNKQPIGRAVSTEIWIAMRDAGDWLDPRWIEDWWANGPGLGEPLPDRFLAPNATVEPQNPPAGTGACPPQ